MKSTTIVSLLFLICFHCLAQPKKTDYTDLLPVIDAWLDAQKDFEKLPGMTVTIVQDQDIIFKKVMDMQTSKRKCQ